LKLFLFLSYPTTPSPISCVLYILNHMQPRTGQ
jgi:hypothetical protein